jgi:hypothetical protein
MVSFYVLVGVCLSKSSIEGGRNFFCFFFSLFENGEKIFVFFINWSAEQQLWLSDLETDIILDSLQ